MDAPAGSAGSAAAAPSTGPAGAAASDPAASGPAATSPALAAYLLAAALEPLRAGAAFDTSVSVDGAVVVSATGRSFGTASTASVTTANRTVDYIRVPPRAWAREKGGSWVLVAASSAPAGPLDTLGSPTTLAVVVSDAGTTTFTATYPAAALGLAGDPVPVTITADASGVTFTHEATASGHRTVSTTTLRSAPADPIVAPGS